MPSHTAALAISRRTSGIAELRRTWPLDMRLDGRRGFRVAISCSGATFRRGRERSASIQVSGFHQTVEPSSEKVMNSARPPIFSHGTGPPRPPCHSGTRLSARIVAVVAHQPDVAGGDGDRAEIVLGRAAELDGLVGAAVGQRLADDRHPAIHLAVGALDAEVVERRVGAAIRTAN